MIISSPFVGGSGMPTTFVPFMKRARRVQPPRFNYFVHAPIHLSHDDTQGAPWAAPGHPSLLSSYGECQLSLDNGETMW